MNNIYTIFSPGRTGSHIILEMLAGTPFNQGGLVDAYGLWMPINDKECRQYIQNQNLVMHTHNLNYIKDFDRATIKLVISLRRDLFAQTMSAIVAEVAKEWSGKDYSNKIIEPVDIDLKRFIHCLLPLKNWRDNLDLSGFKQTVTIYYEDLVDGGAEFLARELQLEYDQARVGHVYQKSPYRYQDIISNWQELYQEYLNIQ